MSQITLLINQKEFKISLEQNTTVEKLLKLLPMTLTMNDLNANEKYVYLKQSLPTNAKSIDHIEAGDVMLFGNNCLVIFYKNFTTSYFYTRLGHIENVDDFVNSLKNGSIEVTIQK